MDDPTKHPDPKGPTLKAVLKYAEELRLRAERQKANNPWFEPYSPSEATARKLNTQHGAPRALEVLASRARAKELLHQEHEQGAKRSLERHQRRQREAQRDREARRRGLTVGQRLDDALAKFSVVGAVGAAQVGWSTPNVERPSLTNHGNPAGEAEYIAIKAIRDIESLLERHQLRDVEHAA